MKIRNVKKTKDKIEFVLEDVTPPLANAFRRVMISKVPTLAIEWLDIFDNNSVLFDEMIALRLGLIPMKFDADKFNLPSDCRCKGKGCSLCQVNFSLDKKGPCTVYSGDMKSTNIGVKPTSPKFPIVELLENHALKLEAVATLGIGESHAKFQAANAVYQYYPETQTENPRAFLFKVETISGLDAADIVLKAAEILQEEAEAFKKELKDI